jgi:peptidase C39-like protein
MRWVRAGLAAAIGLTVAATGHLHAAADRSSIEARPPARVRVLDVPFVPQTRALCGGAALAMVMRFWGEPTVLAEDFSDRIELGGAGIRTDDLVSAARARGWTAFPATGTPAVVQTHLERGRPIIVLLQMGSDAFHYVVVVGWDGGSVIVQDPALGPIRVIKEDAFDRAWAGRGRWYLLVLPSRPGAGPAAEPSAVPGSPPEIALEGCDAIVEEGIRRARSGDTLGAEHRFLAAQALCPTSAAPARELAGLRFGAADWKGAARLAERALVLDPGDSLASRLLAGSLFLGGDTEGALGAWNRLSEPHADLTRIDGLARTRYRAVADQIDLPPGRLLTPETFLRARRRLEEMPIHSGSRLSLRPRAGGRAQVDVALLERPLLLAGAWDAGHAVVRGLVEREVAVNLASPTGNGELWSAGWRWWHARPRVSLGLAVPAAGGRPGIWRVEGLRDRQTYAARALPGSGDPASGGAVIEDRRRAALSFSDWVASALRLEGGAALDRWSGRGRHLSLEGKIEMRSVRDHLTLGATLAGWKGIDGGARFAAGDLLARWGSPTPGRGGWRVRAGISRATSDAPLALWPGAGTGTGRAPLLRAHPLLDRGVIAGRVFGRTLVHGGLERQGWVWGVKPLRLGWALFADAARPWDPLEPAPVPWQVDAGAGIRLAGMGTRGQFRVDLARGLDDGKVALSFGWEAR